jgi:Fur family zinc uptake transcriptional regulator
VNASCHDHTCCIENALSRAKKLCLKKGTRLTPLRTKVLTEIWHDHSPVKAYELLHRINQETSPPHSSIKPQSLYRSLEFLIEMGLIHKISSLNSYIGCLMPDQWHTGCFMICHTCAKVVPFYNPVLQTALTHSVEKHHFSIASSTVEITGQCLSCREREISSCPIQTN